MRGGDYFMRRRDQGEMSPARERLRFALILLGVVAGGLLFVTYWDNDVLGAALLAVGTWLLIYGLIDLIWLATGDVERIWTKTRRQSLAVAALLLLAGAAAIVYGYSRFFFLISSR